MFAVQQPDLNYRNPAVVEEMKNVLRFWLNKGVHGFRMDAIPFLFESSSLEDEPKAENWKWFEPTDHNYLNHTQTENQPETYRMLYEFRDVLDSYRDLGGRTRFMTTECYTSLDKLMPYYSNGSRNGAHFPLNFRLVDRLNRESTAADFVNTIVEWEERKPAHAWSNWFFGNHDQKRASSRFDTALIDALTMLIHLLPGTPITYNGDELGMEDSFVRWDQTVDPAALIVGQKRYQAVSRDFARGPFQWDNSSYAGVWKIILSS
uniref:Maltase A1 n=1 Tax=Cacopsylla melanoneura TaxID=428564 RepID=A0A8D9FDV4_9HEMI